MKQSTFKHLKPAALTLAMAFSISGPSIAEENMDPIEWCSRAASEPARITCIEEAIRNSTGQTPNVIDVPAEDNSRVSVSSRAASNSDTPARTTVTAPAERKKPRKETLLDKLGKTR